MSSFLKVCGKYGTSCLMTYNSFVAMQPKGEMDKSLYPIYTEKVILPLCHTLQMETVQDPKTWCKLRAPSSSRLIQDVVSLTRRRPCQIFEDLEEKGVDIGLGLPNGTKSTQEMDQSFQEHKPTTDKSAARVAVKAITPCLLAHKKIQPKCNKKKRRNSKSAVAVLNKYLEL